ncbi:hypothetical protein Tco_0634111 [Tanacetum coccineum]
MVAAAMSVVYVFTTHILEDGGDDPTVEQVRNRLDPIRCVLNISDSTAKALEIKKNVQLQQPEMIQRETQPWVFDSGFVTITLSGKWMAKPCAMDLPREEHDKFQTIRTCEDVLIFPNAEGQDEPLIRAKRDSSDPIEDLKNLRYGLEKERAN